MDPPEILKGILPQIEGVNGGYEFCGYEFSGTSSRPLRSSFLAKRCYRGGRRGETTGGRFSTTVTGSPPGYSSR